MRIAALCWLCGGLLSLPALAQDKIGAAALESAEKTARAVFRRLIAEARPPLEVGFAFARGDEGARVDCADGKPIGRSWTVAKAATCADSKGLERGYVIAGPGLLTAARNEDQIAAVLAHELGHVVLDHEARENRCARSLYDPWEDKRWAALAPDKRRRLLERFDTDPAAADAYAQAEFEEFLAQNPRVEERMDALSRRYEQDADDYACQLIALAGYDAREASKVYLQTMSLRFMDGSAMSDPPDTTHPKLTDRAWRAFQCAQRPQEPLPRAPKPGAPCETP